MSPAIAVLLFGSGLVAGIVGTAGGITSLISYPALLAAGASTYAANVANLIAVIAAWPASALVSRVELAGQRGWLVRATVCGAIGAAAGTVLFRTTSPALFAAVVPALVALAGFVLLVQPRLTDRVRRAAPRDRVHPRRGRGDLTIGGVSVYGGYFGAGSGVMLLATALIFVDARMPVANGVKNMVVGSSAVVSGAILAATGPVVWSLVLPLAAGVFAGAFLGPGVNRRLPATAVRWTVAVMAFALAGALAAGVV